MQRSLKGSLRCGQKYSHHRFRVEPLTSSTKDGKSQRADLYAFGFEYSHTDEEIFQDVSELELTPYDLNAQNAFELEARHGAGNPNAECIPQIVFTLHRHLLYADAKVSVEGTNDGPL